MTPQQARLRSLVLDGRVRPLPHRILARLTALLDTRELALGLVLPPPRDLLPSEMPTYVVRRLISFLKGRHPIPPRVLHSILPPNEAQAVREEFNQLVASGLTPGEAIIRLGIVTKYPAMSVPGVAYAKILRAGCSCLADIDTTKEEGLVPFTAGEELDPDHRILWCHEFIRAAVPAAAEREAERQRAAARERLAFAGLRGFAA